MSKRIKLIVLMTLISACSSNNVQNNREISSTDEEKSENDKKYYERRGGPGVKFAYDGYTGNLGKFTKAMTSRANRKFTSEAGRRRQELFEKNLFDTGVDSKSSEYCKKEMKTVHRTAQGECYFHNVKVNEKDLHLANQVMMGSRDQRFGRNIEQGLSNKHSRQDLMNPNPLEISQKLLTRVDKKTKEANVINVLASAWLQSMNHDWFTHGKNSKTKSHHVKGHDSHPHFKDGMKVPATQSESRREARVGSNGYDKTSRNRVTHWWDASQIYGSDAATIRKVRGEYDAKGVATGRILKDGKIAVDTKNKRLIYGPDKLPITGFHDNWWVGLDLIQSLFHMEHNRIVDEILKPLIGKEICRSTTGKECGDELFEKARMINAALIAKIHTAEWTPALLDNAMLHVGMRGNWYGMREVFGGDNAFLRANIPMVVKHLVSGLVGKNTLDLYAEPFSLTEEFVAVYRMHPLVPEHVTMMDHSTNDIMGIKGIKDMVFRSVPGALNEYSGSNWMNSFGTSHPGAMTLHNYPSFMQNFVAERNTGKTSEAKHSTRMDMGAIDIIRDRERGVPKYNDFRRGLNLPAIKSFEELTGNAEDIKILKEIYSNDIEKMDLIIGTLAEKDRYPGYAFGNTPFFIFAVMASRRLMADPFFSDYYSKEYYTSTGIDYVQSQDMIGVILNHYPELRSRFYAQKKRRFSKKTDEVKVVKNAFRPWLPVYGEVVKSFK
jgi:hypothetical protein